jgi:hypothetical protein
MHRVLAALIALAVSAPLADAQIIQVPRRSSAPVVWGSLSAGFYQFDRDIVDGNTQSAWRFGSTVQYRGSVEVDVGNSGAAGLAVGYADAPLTYFQLEPTDVSDCEFRCDAHAQVWTVMGTFHMGGGIGFHQIIDISAGTTIYRDFRSDDLGSPLGPDSPDRDLSLSIGYGFGWGFGPRLQLMLVQDAAFTMHQRDGLGGGDNSSSQQYTTRLGARVGLGTKAR